MTDTITLPRAVIQDAIESMQGYARETGDTQPCDAENALRAALAQPVREPLQDALTWELWLNAVDTANNTGRLVAYTYKEAIERAHNIRGEN